MGQVIGIGAAPKRKEDQRFLTGRGNYVSDIKRPGMTAGVFIRSPHAHAVLRGIDKSAALAAPGVVAVLTGEDVAADGLGSLPCGWGISDAKGVPMKEPPFPMLAQGKVRFVGDMVAFVIAETLEQAKSAAELVNVNYEVLPSVVGVLDAVRPDAPQLFDDVPNNVCCDWELGDKAAVEAAFRKAAHVAKLSLVNNRLIGNPMEPRAAIAEYDPGKGHHTLWTTSQFPHVVRFLMSALVLKLPEHKVRVVAPDVGGGFGVKQFHYGEEAVVTWAAKRVLRPVKWVADRSEGYLSDRHGRDHVTEAELALDENGKFLALRVKTLANMGGYLSTFGPNIPTNLYAPLLGGVYTTPAIYCNVKVVFTNTVPVDAYRGAGRPEATFVVERIVDVAAAEMGIDRVELRRRNMIPKEAYPYQTPVLVQYDSGDPMGCLDGALVAADVKNFGVRKAESARNGKFRGLGFSTYVEACGLAPSRFAGRLGARGGLYESATVRVHPAGQVTVMIGTHNHGQGHETTFAQIVCEKLGVPFENVDIVFGDTDRVQFGMGTYGSRSLVVGGAALSKAADKVIVKGKKIAAHLLEASEQDIHFEAGKFSVAGTDRVKTIEEIAGAAYVPHNYPLEILEPGLEEQAYYDPVNFTYPGGCHIAEVEIDPETGIVTLVNYTAVDDVGTVINPMIVEGQLHGGIVQGVGQALYENAVYDESSGQLVSGSLMDYCVPRADHLPMMKVATHSTLCTHTPMGVKGCGEVGTIGSPAAVINAVVDALAHLGVTHVDMPATPNRIWRLLQNASLPVAAEQGGDMRAFAYHQPNEISEAVKLLTSVEDCKVLGGGMTLIPTLKQRLAAPAAVVDLAKLPALKGISDDGVTVTIGAMTPHAVVAASPIVQARIPALAHLASEIGDPAVRNRGTLGGSVANNDPAADYPAAVLGLGATIITSAREIAADRFFVGLFETALEPGEIITAIRFPVPVAAGYAKFKAPASRYALVGVFVARFADGVRVAVTGAGAGVFRVAAMEQALSQSFEPTSIASIKIDAAGLTSDIHAEADYRAHLVTVMAKRAVTAASRQPSGPIMTALSAHAAAADAPSDLARLSAVDLLAGYRRKRFTPVDVVEDVIAALDATHTRCNVVVTAMYEQARADAKRLAAAMRAGEPCGPLAGVPVTIKDLVFVAGVPAYAGSPMNKSFVPDADAAVVSALKAAGAIITCKTTTCESGYKLTADSPVTGLTRNPWNPAHTSGGSSGGAAAAVASGCGPIAIGTDGVGSIRVPSSFCGVFGLKPTFGLVPRSPGFAPPSWASLAHTGPITRTVADAALALETIAIHDLRDAASLAVAERRFDASPRPLTGLRIGASADLGYAAVAPDVRAAFAKAVAVLEDCGARISGDHPGIDSRILERTLKPIAFIEQAAAVAHKTGDELADCDTDYRDVIAAGRSYAGVDYVEAGYRRTQMRAAFVDLFSRVDALVTPTVAVTAFGAGQLGVASIDGTPVDPHLGWSPFSWPINLAGLPAATVPCGFDRDGLPIGLQIIAPWLDEPTIFKIAAAFEEAQPWAGRWPEMRGQLVRDVCRLHPHATHDAPLSSSPALHWAAKR